MGWFEFRPYISVAQRQANAAKEISKMKKKGRTITPIEIDGRTIASTFWGKAWCDNLERYSDYENRLPRGRTYVRNGSVVDLQIEPGKVTALVSGSELYEVEVKFRAPSAQRWTEVKQQCAGQIGTALELLQGKLSDNVMRLMTAEASGLFPAKPEIAFECSCPDSARMCKHVAAVLYGVGARLDTHPELLFVLRKVDHLELIAGASFAGSAPAETALSTSELAEVFGIDIAPEASESHAAPVHAAPVRVSDGSAVQPAMGRAISKKIAARLVAKPAKGRKSRAKPSRMARKKTKAKR